MTDMKYHFEISLLCVAVFGATGHNETTSQNMQSNGTRNLGECIFPPYPQFGTWDIINIPSGSPKIQLPQNTILKIRCLEMSKLEGCQLVVCINGQWFPSIGHCARTCQTINSTSTLSVKCTYKGQESVDCVEPREGTLAEFKCKSFYEDTRLLKPKAICIDGRWSEKIPECTPICGRAALRKQPTLIVHGDKTKKGEFPWQVALYSDSDKALICGGSLLSERVVLTAAHCITDSDGTIFSKEDFIVVAGKYFRQFNHSEDSRHRQVSKIDNMFISDEYRGDELDYVGDIAVMITEKTLTFSSRVQPVCVDWSRVYESDFIDSDDERGYVSGWGYTRQRSNLALELKSLRVPSISRKNCRDFLPDEYKRYMTFDKFCAGYRNNGTSVCGGDSGGGLVFKRSGRYFIAGIVSLAPLADSQEGGCDSQQYSLYTLVYNYTDNLILKALAQFKPSRRIDDEDEFFGGDFSGASTTSKPLVIPNRFPDNEEDDRPIWGWGEGDQTKETCSLPKKPYQYVLLKGSEKLASNKSDVPLNTTIRMSCIKNYKYHGPEITKCTKDDWSPSYFATCSKELTCPPLYDSNRMNVTCTLKGNETDCTDPLVDTVAKFECAPFYEASSTDPKPSVCLKIEAISRVCRTSGVCLNYVRPPTGEWSYIPKCVPACGQMSSTSQGEHPWGVSIFRQKNIICEGSLVATKIIITAAHCIADTKGRILPKEEFSVAVGITGQHFAPENSGFQFSKLAEMALPKTYRRTQNSQSDIAVLVTELPFTFSSLVQPVCIDWGGTLVPPINKNGFVNNWVLNVLTQEELVISGQKCLDSVEEDFTGYYTQDKFCVRNSSVCTSDGRGLVVEENNKYYLVGVSSSMLKSADGGSCDTQYAMFTRVDKYIDSLILQIERRNRD